ncbi:MAG: hypothetical protein ACRD2Z_00520 [Thermoanaerobaculia bacterium]
MDVLQQKEVVMISKPHRLSLTLAGLALALAAPALAFNPQPEPPGSVAVGVTEGQTVQAHVSRTGPPPDDDAPALCDFTVSFFDAAGETLFATAGRVASGQTFSVELPPVGGLLAPGERLVLRAMVHFTSQSRQEREACAAATRSVLELFDTETGRASVVMGIQPCITPPDPI